MTERTALPFAIWVTIWAVTTIAALGLLIAVIAWFVVP
jgi:hypothetical protein